MFVTRYAIIVNIGKIIKHMKLSNLRFNEEDSFVPAVIFFGLCFWLGNCTYGIYEACSNYNGDPSIGLLPYGLVLLGIGYTPIYTLIAAVFYLFKINRFAITSMPEAYVLGVLAMMLSSLNIHIDANELCGEILSVILHPAFVLSLILLLQGLYIRWRRKKKDLAKNKLKSTETS